MKKNILNLLAISSVIAMLLAGCGSSNSAPAKQEDAQETTETTKEEAGSTASESEAVAEAAVAKAEENTPEATTQEEPAAEGQEDVVITEPKEGDITTVLYEGKELKITFLEIAQSPPFPSESEGAFVYDIEGQKCLFEQAIAPGHIDYEKLPEEWQSMIKIEYMQNQKGSEQEESAKYEPQEGDVTTILRDGKEFVLTFLRMEDGKYVYDKDGVTLFLEDPFEKGTIAFEDLPEPIRYGFDPIFQ